MYKPDIVERKMRAIAMIAETTVSYQQIMRECGLSWNTLVEIKKEMVEADISLEHRCNKYKPIELRTDMGKSVELNMGAWHNEVSRQSRRRGPDLGGPSRSRSRAVQNTETLIARYRPSSSEHGESK